jgi:hypothetical protein
MAVCLSRLASTIPSVVKCDHCGRLSAVQEWEPVYEEPQPTDTVYTPRRVKEIRCKIRCSKCGIVIQVMAPLPK